MFIRQIHVGYIIHNKTETPIKTCNVSLAWEPALKRYNDIFYAMLTCSNDFWQKVAEFVLLANGGCHLES